MLQNPQGATVDDISLIFFEQNVDGRYIDREDADLAADTTDSDSFEQMRDRALALRAQFEQEEAALLQRHRETLRCS